MLLKRPTNHVTIVTIMPEDLATKETLPVSRTRTALLEVANGIVIVPSSIATLHPRIPEPCRRVV